MSTNKVLFITQEISPFVPDSYYGMIGKQLPQVVQDAGDEIRIFSPKWGIINERRNQLHEVIRLSGMNLIIDDTDHTLIIKVASLSSARMQIYFIDNDDYFMKRKILCDENGTEYEDNGERAIFYARGVLETMKKLRWIPNVIHCQGWVSCLAPFYIKKAYADEPSFFDSKVVYSIKAHEFENDWGTHFGECLSFKESTSKLAEEVLKGYYKHSDLMKLAAKYSDAIIFEDADEDINPEIIEFVLSLGIPVLHYNKESHESDCAQFFKQLAE